MNIGNSCERSLHPMWNPGHAQVRKWHARTTCLISLIQSWIGVGSSSDIHLKIGAQIGGIMLFIDRHVSCSARYIHKMSQNHMRGRPGAETNRSTNGGLVQSKQNHIQSPL